MAVVQFQGSTPTTAPPTRLVRTLRGCLHAQRAADALAAADAELGRPHPHLSRPTCFSELAEEAVGQLDPVCTAVAERAGALELLAGVDAIQMAPPHDRERVALQVFRTAAQRYRRRLRTGTR
jgi:hypothetical protein